MFVFMYQLTRNYRKACSHVLLYMCDISFVIGRARVVRTYFAYAALREFDILSKVHLAQKHNRPSSLSAPSPKRKKLEDTC